MTIAKGTDPQAQQWANRVIPLPKEIEISGSQRYRADQIGLSIRTALVPPVRTAIGLLSGFTLATEEDASFIIRLALLDDETAEVRDRLLGLPNREQAYAILPLAEREGRLLVAASPVGLLYAARTLAQLVQAPAALTPETELELPLPKILDWPDLSERGQWGGNVASDLAWTSQWKLNVVEVSAELGVVDQQLLSQGAELGVKVVPYFPHLETVSRYAGLMERSELISTPDPARPLPSDYTPGLCMSSPATQKLVQSWLARMAETAGVTDIMVWFSESAAPCFCPKCIGKEPYGLEAACIVNAFASIEEAHPHVRLRLLTTQGSYPVNDKILAAAPESVGVTYYDGGRTYDSSRQPMIYPLLEEYARSGRWLGVYPQITHAWRTVFPWTAPQFIHYRAQEFVQKGLSCMIGYAVPSNRFHEFNVMAEAEWTWNAQGRSPEEFARAYASSTGMTEPDLSRWVRWALAVGEAGWTLAESRLFLALINDPTLGFQKGKGRKADHRFETADLTDVGELQQALATAQQALELAQEAGNADMRAESECILAGLQALELLHSITALLKTPALDVESRQSLSAALDRLDACACTLRTRLPEWGERISSQTGEKLPTRLLDTAGVLLRTCDALRQVAVSRGVPDPQPAWRLRPVGRWSADDFQHGQEAFLLLGLADLVPSAGGSFHIGFDFIDSAWGTSIKDVAVLARAPGQEGGNVIARTPDLLGVDINGVSIWERWKEVRIRIPATPPGAELFLAITLWGMPADAPADRRTCAGAVSIRQVQAG
ncbi:MAG: hypothetical protein CVU38_01270 [Chloroflexi bacterium HGW-Chloroflexi-1]|nr:MAG: hypothetical protein CVU38_01270 [Chloroflexi bacterium HGW-Chloroflexi-1]